MGRRRLWSKRMSRGRIEMIDWYRDRSRDRHRDRSRSSIKSRSMSLRRS